MERSLGQSMLAFWVRFLILHPGGSTWDAFTIGWNRT
jgi:hypothetical protein